MVFSRRAFAIGASLAAAIGAISQFQAQGDEPLKPFYPPKAPLGVHSPESFVPNADAKALVQGSAVKESDFSSVTSLNGDWRFSGLESSKAPFAKDADLDKAFYMASFDDSKWDSIKVPLNWYKKLPKFQNQDAPYVKGWYRRALDIPQGAAGKRVVLHFDVIGYEALLFVNGKEAGSHHGDFTPWDLDITDFVEPGKSASLAIRVFSDFGPSFGVKAPAKHAYGSQWSIGNIKGGIWQDAELRVEPAARVVEALVSTELSSSSISVECKIRNDSKTVRKLDLFAAVAPAEAALATAPASAAAIGPVELQPGENSFTVKVAIPNPRLWTPSSPSLYHLVLPLFENGKPVSAKSVRFGFRSFKAEGGHFFLNGERVYLYGENLPSVGFGGEGKSSSEERAAAAAKILDFKSLGYNILRNPHMPILPCVLDAADELGMMYLDEWCWSFTKELDPADFEKNNLQELAEWVKRDYNHAAAVMWSCGNEVYYGDNALTKANLDKQVVLVRQLDKSGRPVSSFSGSAHGYGKKKLETDVLDLHDYLGLGDKPWPFWSERLEGIVKEYSAEYAGSDGKLPVPLIIWECVGYSWGFSYDKSFVPNDPAVYLSWTRKPTTWGAPAGIGFVGSIGLAAALDPNRGSKEGMALIGRRIMDYLRRDQRFDGFAPWFHGSYLDAATLWNQPVYCGLTGPGDVPLRNVFGGERYEQSLFIVSSVNKAIEGSLLRVSLAEADGSESTILELSPESIAPWSKLDKSLELSIPQADAPRWAQLRVRLLAKDGSELSRNFYDLFVQAKANVLAPLEGASGIGVLSCGASGEGQLIKILSSLKAEAKLVSDPTNLEGVKLLIVPPSSTELSGVQNGSPASSAIQTWVRNGGSLLVLEQDWRGSIGLIGRTSKAVSAVFTDLAVANHPAFKGLCQANFEFWNNPEHGQTASFGTIPLGLDLIAVRGPMLAQRESSCIMSEGRFGRGRIVSSQFDACSLWLQDSAASTFLRNLLEASLSEPRKSINAWEEKSDDICVAKNADIVSIDIKSKANMGFKDDVEGDGKGGWTDQGDNDFRMMPLGAQTFRNVPFKIVDPAGNGGKSCIVLRNEPKGDFLASVSGIKVGEKLSRLFFLHTAAWVTKAGPIVQYKIRYADGQETSLDVVDGISICDWWQAGGNLLGAKLALTKENPKKHEVGLHIMEWDNPRPDVAIESLSAAAQGNATAMIVAISGERANPDAIKIEDLGAGQGAKWSALADGGSRDAAFVPKTEVVKDGGSDALRISMPKSGPGDPKPVVFKVFPAKEKAKLDGAKCRYLSIEVKAECNASVEIALPKDDWKDSLRAELHLMKDEGWRTVRFLLNDDFRLDARKWGLKDLRGEFFIFSVAGDKKEALPAGAIDFAVTGRSKDEAKSQSVSFLIRRVTLE